MNFFTKSAAKPLAMGFKQSKKILKKFWKPPENSYSIHTELLLYSCRKGQEQLRQPKKTAISFRFPNISLKGSLIKNYSKFPFHNSMDLILTSDAGVSIKSFFELFSKR